MKFRSKKYRRLQKEKNFHQLQAWKHLGSSDAGNWKLGNFIFQTKIQQSTEDRNPWYPFSFPKDGNSPAAAITKYLIIPLQLSVTLLGLGTHVSFQRKLKTVVPFSRCISSIRSHRSVLLWECLSSVCIDFSLDEVIIFQHSLFIFEQERRSIKRLKTPITLFKTKPSRTADFPGSWYTFPCKSLRHSN